MWRTMPKDRSYLDFILHDVLKDISRVSAKAMFGGWGLYLDGIIFGIVIDGEFYVKAADADRDRLKRLGSRPFAYRRRRREVALPYWLVPGPLLDEPENLVELVRRATASPARRQ
jgi:DNA transformation protein and related proteins